MRRLSVLIRGLPDDALTQNPTGEGRWDQTHELLATLIEEVSLLVTEPRLAREKPLHITRPNESRADTFARAKAAAQGPPAPPVSEEPVYRPDGGVTAVGAVAMMKAMGGGAIRHVPGPAPEAVTGSE